MTEFEILTSIIDSSDLLFFPINSDKMPAHSLRMEGDCAIFFNESAFDTDAERFIALAHEKAHCDTGMFYSIHTPLMTRGKCERRAWRRTILDQLPFDRLMDAFEACRTEGGVTVYELAEYLGLPPAFVLLAAEEYLCMGKELL